MRAYRGEESHKRIEVASQMVLGKPAKESESLVDESEDESVTSQVLSDTWNLAGRRGDHPPRLNTTQ